MVVGRRCFCASVLADTVARDGCARAALSRVGVVSLYEVRAGCAWCFVFCRRVSVGLVVCGVGAPTCSFWRAVVW